MARRRHSERAKKGTRDQFELIIKTIEADIKNIEREIKLYEKYARKGLSFANRVLPTLHKKLQRRNDQLIHYLEKQAEYKIRGLI